MSPVAISFYALSLIFESCRLSEITLAGPHQYLRNNSFKIPVQKVLNLHTVLIENINEILSAEKKMTDAVEERIRELREHERVMKAKFAEIYEAQQKHHATRLENFELVLTQLQSCIERGESALERNVSAEILQTNQIIVGRCEELLNVTKPDIYKPPHVNYIVENQLNPGLDRIVVSNTDPLLSLAEVDNQELVREKTVANFIIVTRDSSGKQCYHVDDQVKVNIITPADDQLETEIKDTKDGKYTVTYTPQCVGQHRVEIQVNGQPLTGSPWVVQVIPHQYQFAFQFGSEGKEQGQFHTPWDIAVHDKRRTLALADFNNERVQMFDFDGNFLREIAVEAKTSSVAFTESGDLLSYVVRDHNKLALYSECGQFIRYISDEHVKTPWYISVESDGRIITCNIADKRIKILSADGKNLLKSFRAPGCDVEPWSVVYQQDKFFVSYPKANRVMIFNNAGEYLYDIGSNGSGDGQFEFPTGLAIDKFNRLIVCDTINWRLQLFTLDGKYIAGSFFDDNTHLVGCAVSETGHLFVTDKNKHCIFGFVHQLSLFPNFVLVNYSFRFHFLQSVLHLHLLYLCGFLSVCHGVSIMANYTALVANKNFAFFAIKFQRLIFVILL